MIMPEKNSGVMMTTLPVANLSGTCDLTFAQSAQGVFNIAQGYSPALRAQALTSRPSCWPASNR